MLVSGQTVNAFRFGSFSRRYRSEESSAMRTTSRPRIEMPMRRHRPDDGVDAGSGAWFTVRSSTSYAPSSESRGAPSPYIFHDSYPPFVVANTMYPARSTFPTWRRRETRG